MHLQKSYLVVFAAVIVCVIALSQCAEKERVEVRGKEFAAAESCKSCHAQIYNDYLHTNHFKTSSVVNPTFANYLVNPSGLAYANAEKVSIAKKEGVLYQVFEQGVQRISYPIQVAFGSGEKAQTFGYWQQNKLFELPLTYLANGNRWVNSPSLPKDHPYFERAIVSRCFECHSSYIGTNVSFTGMQKNEELKPQTILYGIDCQRCHGPAAKHVEFQSQHPESKVAKFIASYKSLNRVLRLDMCAVCHSGNDQTASKSTFFFKPGDSLSDYFYPDFNTHQMDVHGQQAQQLMQSKCYRKTASLDCVSCHQVHQKEPSLTVFNQKCISCHQNSKHQKALNTNDCVSCHMPLQASGVIKFETAMGKKVDQYFLRSHVIKIYPSKN